ncbi:MAG: hypothetical protein COZ74_10430, partial [Flavobacteriaceae bacterium CG_4_8_14_3_um_filter_31_8]
INLNFYKMKKVLLSLAFVLATGSLVNANTLNNVDPFDCIGFAFELEVVFGEMTYEKFLEVVERCEKFNGQ